MELEIIKKIYIELDEIKKDICEGGCIVEMAVHDYIGSLNDDEYYLIGSDEYDKIIERLKEDGFED